MKLTIKILGILIILISISLLLDPDIIYGWMEDNMNNISLYIIAIIFRLIFGALLIIAAKESRHPGVVNIIGYIGIIAAIILILVGHERFTDIISTFLPSFKPFSPVSGVIGFVIGSFLIYTFSGIKK